MVYRALNDQDEGDVHTGTRVCRDCDKRKYIPRVVTHDQLADEYGVSRSLISMVVAGTIWKED